jgi:hypothetical protein
MALAFADPFDALFRYQRALDQQLESGWLEDVTTGTGAYPSDQRLPARKRFRGHHRDAGCEQG